LIPIGDLEALRQAIHQVLTLPRSNTEPQPPPDERNVECVLELYQELLKE
jgi:hypothetical protein